MFAAVVGDDDPVQDRPTFGIGHEVYSARHVAQQALEAQGMGHEL